MDVNPTQHQDPATGDDELAKVLAGVSDDPNVQPQTNAEAAGLQFEETRPDSKRTAAQSLATPAPVSEPSLPQPQDTSAPTVSLPPLPDLSSPAPVLTSTTTTGLDDIKKSALEELRPLVDKLNLPPEEKFDTILLIIRSTDDQSLVNAAHEAAKGITDETKRAQALLDVIKEIDYFANRQG